MSMIKLVNSIQNLSKNLNQSELREPKVSTEKIKNHSLQETKSMSEQKPLPLTHYAIQNESNVSKEQLDYLSPNTSLRSSKYFVIGIPLMNRGKYCKDYYNYSQLDVKGKTELILNAVTNCIKNIQSQHQLEKKDTVIIQLREYAFAEKGNDFVTVKEKNELLKILSKVFPTPFNLIISTGGMAYAIPSVARQETYNSRKIKQVRNNYLKLQGEHPKFFKEKAPLGYEKKQMDKHLNQKSVNMILHNKNYLLTNQYNLNTPSNKNRPYLSFSKIVPFREVDRQRNGFENTMIYNPSKKKDYVPLDSNMAIHNLTCAEALFSRLIKKPCQQSNLPSILLVNSATCIIDDKVVTKIKKQHDYFFQVDSQQGCLYGALNSNVSATAPNITFYQYNIYNSTLEKAVPSPATGTKNVLKF